ncbi:MAG: YgfZ/GcvT domain-containing protein [Betaproteobacteria bacterium]
MSTHEHDPRAALPPVAPNRKAPTGAVRGTSLPYLAVVEVQGPDAGSFLQGQLTQDALSMSPGRARAGGYCSAKGRLLANFVMLHPDSDTWWLLTHAGLVEPLVKRLKMFVLRARCTVRARPDLLVSGELAGARSLWEVELMPSSDTPVPGAIDGSAAALADGDRVQQPDTAWAVGWWGGRTLWLSRVSGPAPSPLASVALAQPTQSPADSPAQEAWRHADIAAGWPWIEPATVDQFVPQMVNFELLDGVNFRKGCYPGQEVVARSQYRGTLKRRMALFSVQAPAGPLPAASSELFHSEDPGQPAGMVVNASTDPQDRRRIHLLAEVKLAATVSGSLHLGSPEGPALQPQPLPYAIPADTER